MIPSLGEVTATGRKAAKGAGYSWGMADEAGRATAWLWAHGIDGITALADLLDNRDIGTCPITLGTRFCDVPPTKPVSFKQVNGAILLLSFAAELAKITQSSYRLDLGAISYATDPTGMYQLDQGNPDAPHALLSPSSVSGSRLTPAPRREAPAEAWARLGKWEHKTYAPATEASRLAGAGAGLTDND